MKGALWSTGAPQVIGRNRLRRKILCREHNQALSPVDAEAGRTFKAVTELDNWLAASRKTQQEPRFHEAQGPLLERWFLKTTVNLFVLSGAGRTWADGARHDCPPGGLAETTFGNCRLGYPLGLYSWTGRVGQEFRLRTELGFTPWFLGERLAGAHFQFHGLNFLLWLLGAEVPEDRGCMLYRHMGGELHDGPNRAEIKFVWPSEWVAPAVLATE